MFLGECFVLLCLWMVELGGYCYGKGRVVYERIGPYLSLSSILLLLLAIPLRGSEGQD